MKLDQVKQVFAAQKMTSALVVDDVYDDIAAFEDDDLQRAFALLETDDATENAFTAAGGTAPVVDVGALAAQLAADSPLVERLNAALRGDKDTPLRRLARAIFGLAAEDRIARARPLEQLKALLADLDVKVFPFGSDGPGKDEPRHPLIFMDYYLGKKGAPAVQKSIDRVMDIVSRYPHEERPIVVLMSSELNKDRLAQDFRDKSELLGSQFQFVMKDKFGEDGFAFVASLADLVEFVSESRTIGSFVDAWKDALSDAAKDFVSSIRTLDVQDYFHLHAKLGPGAEHRFGDHVSSLFAGYLRKLMEDRPTLRTVTGQMNELRFDQPPPVPFAPSETVGKISYAASFQDLAYLNAKPTAGARLELGDVFFREIRKPGGRRQTEVSIVISQDCDLEHGKTDTVFMIDGTVIRYSAKKPLSDVGERSTVMRVDLFQHDGENYTVEWDARNLRTLPYDMFQKQVADLGFERVARLRTVQALALQQKFAAHITRVAMPETPQTHRFTGGEAYIRTTNGRRKLAYHWKAADRLTCIVGSDKVYAATLLEVFSALRDELKTVDRSDLDAAKLDATIKALGDVDVVRALRSRQLADGKTKLGAIALYDAEGALTAGENLPSGAFLLINLIPH